MVTKTYLTPIYLCSDSCNSSDSSDGSESSDSSDQKTFHQKTFFFHNFVVAKNFFFTT